MISIVIPHAVNPENDRILKLNLNMLKENTTCEYEVLLFADTGGRVDLVYPSLDWMIRHAKYDLVLWGSSDVVLAPGWDANILKYKDIADWICLQLVECGQVGVHSNNIHKNFGIKAIDFNRNEFEEWVNEYSKDRPDYREGFCWYSPSVFSKRWYIENGGFDLRKPFPHHADMDFIEKVKRRTKFITANSYAYHFQRSGENIGEKPER